MIKTFSEILEKAKKLGRTTVSVAVAQDMDILMAVKAAYDEGIADAILIGDAALIKPLSEKAELPENICIIDEPDADKAALKAVSLVREGKASILAKGLINTSNFLRAALNEECGLRSGKILSHLTAYEIPGEKKLLFQSDGGVNIAPNLEQKKAILINSLDALRALGIDMPKVAVLTANEQVNPKMPATVDAKALVDMAQAGELPPCIIEGPIAMDVAACREAAEHKGIKSKVSGDADFYLVPNIESGNLVGKALVCYAKAKIGGVILGATHPMVLVSRSDSAEAKLYSIALACLITNKK